ncbi:MAG: RNA 2',3'-cyclic phosphodiesterase [Candidatus Lokiarchaeia archaeon]
MDKDNPIYLGFTRFINHNKKLLRLEEYLLERIRAFIAIDIEDNNIIQKILDIQGEISQTGAKLKLVESQSFHFTLKFLGNISSSMIDEIYGAMNRVEFSPFELELLGVGCFPSLSRINNIWIGTRKGGEEVSRIQNYIETQIRKLKFKPEKRKYTPHTTIARVKSAYNKDKLAKIISNYSSLEIGSMTVESIRLKSSKLTPKGPIYSVLRSIP